MIKNFLIVFLLLVIIDAIWLKITLPIYDDMVYGIQNDNIRVKYFYGLLSYVIIALGMVYFVLPILKTHPYAGLMYGLIIYASFDFINMAIFNNWNIYVSLMDIAWGCVLCYTVSRLFILSGLPL